MSRFLIYLVVLLLAGVVFAGAAVSSLRNEIEILESVNAAYEGSLNEQVKNNAKLVDEIEERDRTIAANKKRQTALTRALERTKDKVSATLQDDEVARAWGRIALPASIVNIVRDAETDHSNEDGANTDPHYLNDPDPRTEINKRRRDTETP